MLNKYNKASKKIAMGLLASMPIEHHDLKVLQETIRMYEEYQDYQLYLWKEQENFVGLIGIKLSKHTFAVHHIAVIPSFRNNGIGNAMIASIQQIQESRAMTSTKDTQEFLEKCWKNQK